MLETPQRPSSAIKCDSPAADGATPLSTGEAKRLLDPFADAPVIVLAVSGGPDSTALLTLAARWRSALGHGPRLIAVTIDHGLRPQSAGEAKAVKRLAHRLGVPHRTLRWRGRKPTSGLQEAARAARYRLLANAAAAAKATHIITAHTLDDQAETVLIRMTRGSGLTGLCAMSPLTTLPAPSGREIALARPLLDIPKARLVATLKRAGIGFAHDPSNSDPRFARTRLRALMPALAREGLDARRLALLARRMRRADSAVETLVLLAASAVSDQPWPLGGPLVFDAPKFVHLPEEVQLRLLARAIVQLGAGAPVRLGRLEALCSALASAKAHSGRAPPRLRRTLAGALVTLAGDRLVVERAPLRRSDARASLTTARHGKRALRKRR